MTEHGMSFMNNALISSALLSVLAGITVNLNGDLARAGDPGSQGVSKDGGGRIRVEPVSGDSGRGEDLYQASCIVCHGPRAVGGIGPRLANNPVLLNDQAFWKVVYEGRHVMPPLKGAVTEQQMADIRAWLQTLR
jgi:mono/diheme cytochrome c family protein